MKTVCPYLKKPITALLTVIYLLSGLLTIQVSAEDTEGKTVITQHGVTWTFDKNYEYGCYANGDYWVKTDDTTGTAVIESISPDIIVGLNTDGSMLIRNGWEVNPRYAGGQALDDRVGNADGSLIKELPYEAAGGQSLVKVISAEGANSYGRGSLQTSVVLTIVDEIPAGNGSTVFRPPYVGDNKKAFSVNDIKWDKLPSYSSPVGKDIPSLEWIVDRYGQVRLDHKPGMMAIALHSKDSYDDDYGAAVGRDNAVACLRLMLGDSHEEKKQAMINYLQYGIDLYQMLLDGADWPNHGGGHQPGRPLPLAFTAVMFDDAEMMQKVSESYQIFHEYRNLYFSPQANYDNGQVLWGSWDMDTTTKKYWEILLTHGGNRSVPDPYGYIDGGYEAPASYQFLVAKPWKGTVLAAHLMPSLRPVLNNEDLFEYVERWVNIGTWTQPDFAAPADGIVSGGPKDGQTCTMTGDPGEGGTLKLSMDNYGITFGDNKADPGSFIPDTNPADGMGRLPDGHNISADTGYYGHKFIDIMWNNYRSSVLSISRQPRSKKIPMGKDAVFSVEASGDPEYQWQFNGTNLPGETSSELVIRNVSKVKEGNYSVVLSNVNGTVASETAVLEVIDHIPSVQNPSVSTDNDKLSLSWEKPAQDGTWDNIIIVRKQGSVPEDPYDGLMVYNGTGNVYEDSLTGEDNYYSIYTRKAFATNIVYSDPITIKGTALEPKQLVPAFRVEPGLAVEVGEDVYFNAEGTSYTNAELLKLARYEWDFGDGYVFQYGAPKASDRNSGIGVLHHFMKPGVYDVTLKVSVFEYSDGNIVEPAIEVESITRKITVTGEAPIAGFELLRAPFHSRLAQFITAKIPGSITSNSSNRLVVTLSRDGGTPVEIYNKSSLKSEEKFLLEQRDLLAGNYRLVSELRDAGGRSLSRWVEKFEKPYDGIPETGINEWNAICVDGKPKFIITPYMLDYSRFGAWDGALNSTYTIGYYPNSPNQTPANWLEYLSKSQEKGWMSIGPGRGSYTNQLHRHYARNYSIDGMTQFVDSAKGHDAMLMWNWFDEPQLGGRGANLPPPVMGAWNYASHSADPQHPVLLNLYGYNYLPYKGNSGDEYDYINSRMYSGKPFFYADVLTQDVYAFDYRHHATLKDPDRGAIDLWVNAIDNFRNRNLGLVPYGIFAQIGDVRDDEGTGPAPSEDEILMQAWLAVAHGAKMLNWFSHFEYSTFQYNASRTLVAQMNTYEDIILGPDNIDQITDNSNERNNRIDTLTRKKGNDTYLFAVRLTEPEPLEYEEQIFEPDTITTTFTVPGINNGRAEVLDNAGKVIDTINVVDGKFTDTFDKYEICFYKISDRTPAPGPGTEPQPEPGTDPGTNPNPETNPNPGTVEMSAEFVSCTAPDTVITDQVFEAQIVMKNNGTVAWGQNSDQIKVTLVSQGPAFNTTWGTYFIIMGQGNTVRPGETFTFTALLRAPGTPGSYDFSWRCLNDIPGGGVPVNRNETQFGETASKRITVTQRQETKPADPPHRNGILDASDLEYVGSFQTNNVQGQENIYTESGLTLRNVNGSKHLLLRTGTYNYRLYEIGIPTPVKITGNTTIPTAPLINDWGELSYGQINGETIGANAGMWFDNSSNTLYWSHYNSYYTGGAGGFPQLAATRLNSDGTKANVGYWYLPDGLQKYKGYWGGVTKLSSSFANTYTGGRELALGFGGYYSICGSASRGPALAAVKLPSGSGTRLDMKEMMYYPDPIAAPRDGNYFSNIYWRTIPDNLWEGEWTGVDICRAGVFIDLPEKKGYLAFANQGIGRIGYDYGGYNADGSYQNCWYFYNINDLGAAASGTKSPTSIVPTSFTTVEYPSESGSTFISGACFDEETRMLYLYAKMSAGYNGRPVIHVYHVKEGYEGESPAPPEQKPEQPSIPSTPPAPPTQQPGQPLVQLPVQQPEKPLVQPETLPSVKSPASLFKVVRPYKEANFKDVPDDWGKESIELCFMTGLMNGRSNQRFAPNEPATIAEVVTIAARIRDIFSGGDGVIPSGKVRWYDNSVESAIEAKIILQDQFSNYGKNASRAEVAAILANALPESEYAGINNIVLLPDVDKSMKYSTEIFKLYNAGIVGGNDAYGTFGIDRTITRKELSAIICRLIFLDKRLKLTFAKKP